MLVATAEGGDDMHVQAASFLSFLDEADLINSVTRFNSLAAVVISKQTAKVTPSILNHVGGRGVLVPSVSQL